MRARNHDSGQRTTTRYRPVCGGAYSRGPLERRVTSMEASEFNQLFDELVSPAFTSLGGHQTGRRLFWNSGSLTVALSRTETRYQPPPHLTLCIRHNSMRMLDQTVPQTSPTEPSNYMIKAAPSTASDILLPNWRYQPFNLSRSPYDEVNYRAENSAVVRRLQTLREQLDAVLPGLEHALTPAVLKYQLQANGSQAWIEALWIDDLDPLDSDP